MHQVSAAFWRGGAFLAHTSRCGRGVEPGRVQPLSAWPQGASPAPAGAPPEAMPPPAGNTPAGVPHRGIPVPRRGTCPDAAASQPPVPAGAVQAPHVLAASSGRLPTGAVQAPQACGGVQPPAHCPRGAPAGASGAPLRAQPRHYDSVVTRHFGHHDLPEKARLPVLKRPHSVVTPTLWRHTPRRGSPRATKNPCTGTRGVVYTPVVSQKLHRSGQVVELLAAGTPPSQPETLASLDRLPAPAGR